MNKRTDLIVFLIFLIIPLSSASSASSEIHSIGSYHLGSAGNTPEGTDFTSRDIITYQQAGNDNATSEIYSLSLGWFKRVIVPSEEEPAAEEEAAVGGGGGGVTGVQFDIKILDFESPIPLGESFDFTYFVKGIGDINNDVTIDFWIEKDGEIITSGSNVIFMGSNEEKIGTASLFLPTGIESGIYQFNIKVSFGSISAESHRTIELTIDEDIARIEQLFDIRFSLEEIVVESIDELRAIVTFENFGTEPIPVNLTFIILNQNGNEIHREKENVTVTTENVLRKSFEGLSLDEGKYTLVLQTLYNVDVFDEFRQDFEIRKERRGITGLAIDFVKGEGKWWIGGIVGVILIIVLILLSTKKVKEKRKKKLKRIRKMMRYKLPKNKIIVIRKKKKKSKIRVRHKMKVGKSK